jgi:TMEM175 potassium channel family protein
LSRGRLETFSDAVLAVVITIMVLNLHPPAGDSLTDLSA